MARFARIAAPLLVVAVVYAGWLDQALPEQPLFPIFVWIGALLIAIYFSALTVLNSQDKVAPRTLACWGLVIKLALLPVFLITLILTIGVPLDRSNGNIGGLLLVFFILPLDVGVYCLMLVSSFHGFAVTKRLLAEHTIPTATAKNSERCTPFPSQTWSRLSGSMHSCVDSTVPLRAAFRTPSRPPPPMPPHRPASPGLAHQPSHRSEQSQPNGWHIHHPEKTRKRSLRELFKHVRVGIHEVNSDIDSTLRLLRRLNDHPRPVVLEDRDRPPRPIHLCCHSRKIVLRLGKPHRQC